jgi:hypothetical protein
MSPSSSDPTQLRIIDGASLCFRIQLCSTEWVPPADGDIIQFTKRRVSNKRRVVG